MSSPVGGEGAGVDRLAELRVSARGWHGVQMAVLGFIGLCGVLQQGAGEGNPRWLQILAGLLVLTALVLSCLATALVATAAWPLYGSGRPRAVSARTDATTDVTTVATADEGDIRRTGKLLRQGIAMTFIAVAVLALAATSSWWPRPAKAAPDLAQLTTRSGEACGSLLAADDGTVALEVAGRRVVVAINDVVSLRPVQSCD